MAEKLPIEFDAAGLVTVVVQDHLTGDVRMVAHATAEAVQKTLETGRATFWSRSRGELWEKGQTSGNALAVRRVLVDCDSDCLIYEAEPHGPTCHTGAPSCFFQVLEDSQHLAQRAEQPQTVLARLEETLEARKASTAGESYTKSLYAQGKEAIAAKIREEADELAVALAKETNARVVAEAADLMYHVMVGLRHREIPLREVLALLDARGGTSGHAEKASRSVV
jgi:phosphoribosyl-ATP pyrophosphohydrolase/phosphoribosyl-AMP cyclohydrolase